MKFSNLYEEVQKLSDFARISHEAVVHPKSELHYWIGCLAAAKKEDIA